MRPFFDRSDSRRMARRPDLVSDETGVSEVVGFIITFGIISAIMVLSMVAFTGVQGVVEKRLVEERASSAAHRIASSAVEASLLAETYGTDTTFSHQIDLLDEFEGWNYTLRVRPSDAVAGTADRVIVTVPGLQIKVTAALFSAGAPSTFNVCKTSIAGGPVLIRFDQQPAGSGTYCLFLEEP